MKTRFPKMTSGRSNRRTAALIFCLGLLSIYLIPATAFAQTPVSECGAERGTFTLVPSEGPAGSAFTVSGSVQLQTNVTQAEAFVPSVISSGPDFEVWWVESSMSDATLLGIMPSSLDEETFLASFSSSFMVPEASVPGQHQVAINIVETQTPACEDFTVTTTVQEDAYAQTATSLPASLPSTGFMLITPLAGFMAMAAGGYIIRRRNR